MGSTPAETCALLGIDHVPAELRDLDDLAVAGAIRTTRLKGTRTATIEREGCS